LVGRQEGHLACKKLGAGMLICLERGADLHTAQLMPLPLTVCCFSKIQIGFTFLVPAHLDSPRKRTVKWLCMYTDQPALAGTSSLELVNRRILLVQSFTAHMPLLTVLMLT